MARGIHMLGRKLPKEVIEKIRQGTKATQFKIGHKFSPQTLQKMRNARLGKTSGMKGRKHSPEITLKISNSKLERFKDKTKHPRWKVDRSSLQRYGDDAKDRRSGAYNAWRKEVWLRDNFKCKIANPDCAGRIEVHHILSYAKFPELRYKLTNGITLCHFHHPRKREDEKKLTPYFQSLVGEVN